MDLLIRPGLAKNLCVLSSTKLVTRNQRTSRYVGATLVSPETCTQSVLRIPITFLELLLCPFYLTNRYARANSSFDILCERDRPYRCRRSVSTRPPSGCVLSSSNKNMRSNLICSKSFGCNPYPANSAPFPHFGGRGRGMGVESHRSPLPPVYTSVWRSVKRTLGTHEHGQH